MRAMFDETGALEALDNTAAGPQSRALRAAEN